jgi:hypothetical protein
MSKIQIKRNNLSFASAIRAEAQFFFGGLKWFLENYFLHFLVFIATKNYNKIKNFFGLTEKSLFNFGK